MVAGAFRPVFGLSFSGAFVTMFFVIEKQQQGRKEQ